MSAWTDLKESIRTILLMESRIDALTTAVNELSIQGLDHEKRLIRIETLIEVAKAQGRNGGAPKLPTG